MSKCAYILQPDRFWTKERPCYYTGRHEVNGSLYCKTHAAIVARKLGAETSDQIRAERDLYRRTLELYAKDEGWPGGFARKALAGKEPTDE